MRTLLKILLAFVGITATFIGMMLIAYPILTAYDLSMDFLSPAFSINFIIPGIMFILTGIINLSALLSVIQQSGMQYNLSLMSGFLMMVWVVIHSVLLQTIPWLYLTYLICGFLIELLSWQLKGKWAV